MVDAAAILRRAASDHRAVIIAVALTDRNTAGAGPDAAAVSVRRGVVLHGAAVYGQGHRVRGRGIVHAAAVAACRGVSGNRRAGDGQLKRRFGIDTAALLHSCVVGDGAAGNRDGIGKSAYAAAPGVVAGVRGIRTGVAGDRGICDLDKAGAFVVKDAAALLLGRAVGDGHRARFLCIIYAAGIGISDGQILSRIVDTAAISILTICYTAGNGAGINLRFLGIGVGNADSAAGAVAVIVGSIAADGGGIGERTVHHLGIDGGASEAAAEVICLTVCKCAALQGHRAVGRWICVVQRIDVEAAAVTFRGYAVCEARICNGNRLRVQLQPARSLSAAVVKGTAGNRRVGVIRSINPVEHRARLVGRLAGVKRAVCKRQLLRGGVDGSAAEAAAGSLCGVAAGEIGVLHIQLRPVDYYSVCIKNHIQRAAVARIDIFEINGIDKHIAVSCSDRAAVAAADNGLAVDNEVLEPEDRPIVFHRIVIRLDHG